MSGEFQLSKAITLSSNHSLMILKLPMLSSQEGQSSGVEWDFIAEASMKREIVQTKRKLNR